MSGQEIAMMRDQENLKLDGGFHPEEGRKDQGHAEEKRDAEKIKGMQQRKGGALKIEGSREVEVGGMLK